MEQREMKTGDGCVKEQTNKQTDKKKERKKMLGYKM